MKTDDGIKHDADKGNNTSDNSGSRKPEGTNMNIKIKEMVYEVGKLLPEIANGESIGTGAKLEMNKQGGLALYGQMPNPAPEDIQDFKKLRAIGLYRTPAFKQGLCLWQFNNNLFYETPFNPSLYPDNRVKQMGEADMMYRFLVDGAGILRSMNVVGLQFDFLQTMKSIWTDPTLDWGDYSERITWLYSNFNTDELWNRVTSMWVY